MPILKKAHKEAQKGKKHYTEIKEMKGYEQYYLKELQNRLVNKTYNTSEYTIKTINDKGKERTVYKLPYFPDRIAQWAIMLVIEPLLKNRMILDTYSAIPNRGIHFGLRRLHKGIENKESAKYCLKMDVEKYYPSIKHDILKSIYRKIFKDPELLWLLDEIIDSTEGDTGIPIGNFLSQWSGNLYLAYFDHWCKEELKCKNYYRYMDDIVILDNSKEKLHDLRLKIKKYLNKELKLKIKDNWQVFPTYVRGIDFLGYRSFGDYTLLRKSTAKDFKSKMRKLWNKNNLNSSDYCSINSYRGWLKWGNCYNLTNKYLSPLKNKIKEYERRNKIGEFKTRTAAN
jgi:hypothetical protein